MTLRISPCKPNWYAPVLVTQRVRRVVEKKTVAYQVQHIFQEKRVV